MRKRIFPVIMSAALASVMTLCMLAVPASAANKKSISLDKKAVTLSAGETVTLKPKAIGFGKCAVIWSSSDKKVAQVKKGGVVTALSGGTAVITVRVKDTKYKAQCRVTVKEAENAAGKAPVTITADGKECRLTFEDNFDGTELDLKKWSRCPEWKRQDLNNYWDDSMSYLDGKGNLIIEASYDAGNDRFLTGGIRSKDKFEQAFGYYEIRCTVNNIPGYWTAFWLMGTGVGENIDGGLSGTEIDIVETPYYKTGEIQNTLNWNGYGSKHRALGNVSKVNVYDGEFHTFSLLWTEKEYVFYTDGKETWRTEAKEALGTCRVPLYMKVTSETGSWTGTPDINDLPDKMTVDYVRVYELTKG